MQVQEVSETKWQVRGRGMVITLTHRPDAPEHRRFTVHTDNASARAWGRGVSLSWREFPTLAKVEEAYKSLRGISSIISVGA